MTQVSHENGSFWAVSWALLTVSGRRAEHGGNHVAASMAFAGVLCALVRINLLGKHLLRFLFCHSVFFF